MGAGARAVGVGVLRWGGSGGVLRDSGHCEQA